jgi:hypothetical protein
MFDRIGSVGPTTNAFQANSTLSGIEPAAAAASRVAGNRRQSAPITAAQVEAQARVAAQKYWTLYQKQLPEAFSNPASGLSRTTPIIRFARSQAEFDAVKRPASRQETAMPSSTPRPPTFSTSTRRSSLPKRANAV